MKKILVLGLCCGVTAVAFAGTADKLSMQKDKSFSTAGAAAATVKPATEIHPVEELSQPVLEARRFDGMVPKGNMSIEETLYGQMKGMGEEIPAWLQEAVFGLQSSSNASRTGGDDSSTATPITFTAGGTYQDIATTTGFTDVVTSGSLTAPLGCNTSLYSFSSFGGPDAWYTFTLTDFYEVSASVCDQASYDTCLGILDADLNLVAVNDDSCTGYTSLIEACCLPPGTYFVVVDSYGAASGDYTLDVTFGAEPCVVVDPCDDFVNTTVTLPFSGTGTNVGAVDIYGSSAGDVGYTFTLAEESIVSLATCLDGTDFDTDSYLFSGDPCDGGAELLYVDGDFACTFAGYATGWELSCETPLAAGTYTVIITGYSSSEGNFAVTIDATPTSEACVCDEVMCDGTAEVEENGTYELAQDILCGETICGTTFTQGDTLRDIDIFEVLLLDDNILTVDLVVGEFNALVQVVADDTSTVIAGVDAADFCQDEQLVTDCLPAGTYYVLVAHNAFSNVDAGADYALTVSCEPCTYVSPCEAALPLTCDDVVTGSTVGNPSYVGNTAGDQFFEVTMPFSAVATFSLCDGGTTYDSYLRLYDSCPTDPGAVALAINDDFCGLQSTIEIALTAGTYYLVVEGYSANEGDYSLSMTCTTCDPIDCVGTPEVEPNDGPNGDGTYGAIACGETVCGTTFTFNDGVNDTRDTDWFEIVLTEDNILDIYADVEEFDAQLLVLAADAASVVASVDANGFCADESLNTGCLQAGTYYIFISHNGFTGVDTPANYGLSVTCTPCTWVSPYVDCQATTSPDGVWTFGVSEFDTEGVLGSLNRFERFGGVSGAITAIDFEGLQLANGFVPCSPEEAPMTFNIDFYGDGVTPGAPVASFTVSATGVPSGVVYAGTYESLLYSVELPTAVALTDGWVSIQGAGDPACWFLWASAGEAAVVSDGTSLLDQDGVVTVEAFDLSYCLTSELVCDSPINLEIALLAGNAAISWDAIPGATSYNVYASADGYGPFTLLGNTAVASYTDLGAQTNGRRCYQVVAVCE